MSGSTKDYELIAGSFNETTSKPGEPFTFKTHVKGAKVKLDAEQAQRLIDAGAVKDPSSKSSGEKPGAQPRAPKGKGPEGAAPAGSGSTAGSGDGQGGATQQGAGPATT